MAAIRFTILFIVLIMVQYSFTSNHGVFLRALRNLPGHGAEEAEFGNFDEVNIYFVVSLMNDIYEGSRSSYLSNIPDTITIFKVLD